MIDFEASSLDQDGYPIEVGLALWPAPDAAILGWSTLITPAGDWSRHGHWSPKSAQGHSVLPLEPEFSLPARADGIMRYRIHREKPRFGGVTAVPSFTPERAGSDPTGRTEWPCKSARVHGILGRDLVAHGQLVDRVGAALNEALGAGIIAWCDGDAYDIHWTGALYKAANTTAVFKLGQWHRLIAMLSPAMRERRLSWLEQAPAQHRAREDAEQLLFALAQAVEIDVGPAQDLAERWPVLAALCPVERALACNVYATVAMMAALKG